MRYCLNASTIRPTPLLDKIRIAGETGYGAIELWHDDLDAYIADGGTLADVKSALADQNLAVPTTIYLAGWFDATPEAYPAALEECKRRLGQAAELGAPHVIASPAASEADYAVGAVRYRELLEIGATMGVKPSMEFLGFVDQFNTIEDALDVMTRCAHPDVTTILDPFHIFRGGGDMESILKLKPEQVAISHFNDTPDTPSCEEQHDHNRVMPGEGHLDLAHYCALLREIDYDGWLSLELFNEKHWAENPSEVARIGLGKMSAISEELSE
ncbi:MAG: sugar phosphate isomerase/epimerase family protein [Verrucomicrobiota bacterium]|jgi:sugar phosphate isomerase/epimerase|nr:sugar phosphate isomerase/epimerase family protein [Verrucomicrobiota bacterium]